MLQGNAGLKPKEGEYTSRPWEWPINLRVCILGILYTVLRLLVDVFLNLVFDGLVLLDSLVDILIEFLKSLFSFAN